MTEAPLYVPAELQRHGGAAAEPRWFRMAVGICPRHVRLRSALPAELREGPIALRLHLPLDLDPPPPPLHLVGVAGEVVVDEAEESERAELRLVLIDHQALSEGQRVLIERYATRRLALDQLPPGS